MSQTNLMPRPPFWKVPDYINDSHYHQQHQPKLTMPHQVHHREPVSEYRYTKLPVTTVRGTGTNMGVGMGTNSTSQYHHNYHPIAKPVTGMGPSAFATGTCTKSLLKKHRSYEKSKKRVHFRDTVDEYDYHTNTNGYETTDTGCTYSSPPLPSQSSPLKVQVGSPAFGEVLRGDIICKIGEYDARDVSHADAQTLFRTAGNEINLVVHRDSKIAYTQGLNTDSRPNSSLLSTSPDSNLPHRAPSPFLPGPGQYEHALEEPLTTLPQTVFPNLNQSGGYVTPSSTFQPMPTRDHQQDVAEEQATIVNQPYRTTPLVLPGAKVKKDAPTTESYLRHYPNPAVRAHPHHDFHDSVMKQRVADTMLHRVVGQDADTGRVFHKQFNSPIGLYSENNIENTIRQTVPYKPTVLYDPSKSETFKALQEAGYDCADYTEEVTVPVQPKVFQPNRMVPGKKLLQSAPVSRSSYHVVNSQDETIRQSGSFNRLMHSVLGASNY
ncbi:PDZ_signaling and DUF4749 domain-containing protein Zasp66 isoform X2 [Haematobia irritans]|uniref:PDZ_signaling and DUF4749 domain-containing protein Zasp66 isoform X2 n=1 Tax=Haematobia irritans TaxID=7368 RepID=UPI003F50268B